MTAQDELGQRGYQYKHGDRALDGFTIERAAGRGGFGEVYFARSDSGREVALKVVNTYEQIELRGISQCMNLKNPHLVTIFDVKYGEDGRPWVIMEYVNGPSLRDIIDASPSGLGTAKAAFFLREVGKGLTYLHDCGIVHRDLKPGNIFYEDGYVKIGDYGLSKAMSMTRHSGQTVAVGTLHYMAPEIGEGKYDRSIDIYALGALLYEMLTGQVPFLGSSPAEVLMKHLRAEVNLEGLEEPFKSVVRKAMAKNPDERYRSVQEMVEAVFGSDQVRNSVSQFSPAALSMMAGHAARNIGDGAAGVTRPPPDDAAARFRSRMRAGGYRMRRALGMKDEDCWRPGGVALERDRLALPARATMAVGAAFLTAIAGAAIHGNRNPMTDAFELFWVIVIASAAAYLACRFIGPSILRESDWVRKLAIGTPVALAVWLLCAAINDVRGGSREMATCATLFLICWGNRAAPWRKERVSAGDAFSAALCAFVMSIIFSTSAVPVIAVAVGASLAVSLFSPWGRPVAAQKGVATSPPVVPPPFVPTPSTPFQVKPPPIPNVGSVTTPPTPFQLNPLGAGRGRPFPAWAIVAIVLGTFAIVFGSAHRVTGGFIPWFMFPPIIAITFGMAFALRAGSNRAPSVPAGASGSFSGASSIGQAAASAAHGLVATIGGCFMIASILLAIALVANVPGLLQSSLVASRAHEQIERSLGADWPHLLFEFGLIACIAFGWIGLLLTLVGRRRGGGMHMIRAIIGVGVVFAAIASLRGGLPDWNSITPRDHNPGAIVDAYVQHIDVTHAIWAGAVYLVGWILLVWPAKRRDPAVIYQTIAPGAASPEAKAPQ